MFKEAETFYRLEYVEGLLKLKCSICNQLSEFLLVRCFLFVCVERIVFSAFSTDMVTDLDAFSVAPWRK